MTAAERIRAALGDEAPTSVRVQVERIEADGSPDDWAQNWVSGQCEQGWAQLADRVVARAAGADWVTTDGTASALDGLVLTAEGIDAQGRSWRLRRIGGRPVVWRLTEGEGKPAFRFHRFFVTTVEAVALKMQVHEYWALQSRDELHIEAAPGEAWMPYYACFAGWGDHHGQ